MKFYVHLRCLNLEFEDLISLNIWFGIQRVKNITLEYQETTFSSIRAKISLGQIGSIKYVLIRATVDKNLSPENVSNSNVHCGENIYELVSLLS